MVITKKKMIICVLGFSLFLIQNYNCYGGTDDCYDDCYHDDAQKYDKIARMLTDNNPGIIDNAVNVTSSILGRILKEIYFISASLSVGMLTPFLIDNDRIKSCLYASFVANDRNSFFYNFRDSFTQYLKENASGFVAQSIITSLISYLTFKIVFDGLIASRGQRSSKTLVGKVGGVLKTVLKEFGFLVTSLGIGAVTPFAINNDDVQFCMKNLSRFIDEFDILSNIDRAEFCGRSFKIISQAVISCVASYLILKIIFDYFFASKKEKESTRITMLENFICKWPSIRNNVPQDLREIFEPLYIKYLANQNKLGDLSEDDAGKVIEEALTICVAKTENA